MTYKAPLFNGHQEVLIFSIFTLVSKYFYLIIKNKISKNILKFYIVIVMLLLINSMWIKNEAMFFSFVPIFLMLCLPQKSFPFKLLIFLSFFTIIFLRFFIFTEIGQEISALQPQNYEYKNLDFSYLINSFALDRILLIFKYLFFGLVSNIVYIISLLMMLFMLFYRKNSFDQLFYLFFLILNFLLIFSFYILTSVPIEWQLNVSIERILFEVLGIYLIPIIIFVNVYFKKISKF